MVRQRKEREFKDLEREVGEEIKKGEQFILQLVSHSITLRVLKDKFSLLPLNEKLLRILQLSPHSKSNWTR